ncbi:MAG: DUF1573 domain-containing protein [candidate division Zixibacteria bacterium]|nr:DUF1573 domain-containing protein [candidate division Zixibacteria bacterium]
MRGKRAHWRPATQESMMINNRFPTKYLWTIAAIAFLATTSLSVIGHGEPVGPRVKTPHEVFDFGVVPQRCEVSHVFWLHSTGDQELVIEELVPNCGCTEAPLETDHIMPGDSARAEIIFGTGVFNGVVEKFTQIKSNSTGRAPALTFRARVFADSLLPGPIMLTPPAVRLDDLRPSRAGDGYEQAVTLTNVGAEPVSIEMIDMPYRDVRVGPFEPISLGPGDSHELTLAFESELPEQTFSRSITFAVSDTTQQRITLPIFKKSAWDATGSND